MNAVEMYTASDGTTRLSVTFELRRRMTRPLPGQDAYLCTVLRGHARYYDMPGNCPARTGSRSPPRWQRRRTLRRRGNRHVASWSSLRRHLDRWLPPPRICHPWPSQRLGVITQGRSPARSCRSRDLWRGWSARIISTPTRLPGRGSCAATAACPPGSTAKLHFRVESTCQPLFLLVEDRFWGQCPFSG